MIRGMFPKLLGAVLPKEYEATALLLDLQKDDSALLDPDVQALLERLVSDGIHKTYGDVLDVYALHDDDDRYCSMWLVRLHGAFVFVGFTAPRNA